MMAPFQVGVKICCVSHLGRHFSQLWRIMQVHFWYFIIMSSVWLCETKRVWIKRSRRLLGAEWQKITHVYKLVFWLVIRCLINRSYCLVAVPDKEHCRSGLIKSAVRSALSCFPLSEPDLQFLSEGEKEDVLPLLRLFDYYLYLENPCSTILLIAEYFLLTLKFV